MTQCVLGIDLGASLLKFVTMSEKSVFGAVNRIPSREREGPEGVLAQIQKAVDLSKRDLPDGCGISAIGLGTPGMINTRGEIIGEAVNIPGWYNVPLQALVSDMAGLPVFVQNDVNITALGEYLHGAGRGYDNLVCVSIGTGIGGGLIVNGAMYTGDFGLAGEMGHMITDFNGDPCGCGLAGCLEQYSSARGMVSRCIDVAKKYDSPLAREALSNPGALTAEILFSYVRRGDPLGIEIKDTACLMLARALGQVLNLLSPSLIVLCGGVMKSGDLILPALLEHLPAYSLPVMRGHCEVKAGELGPDAGVIGAAAYALMNVGRGGQNH